MFFYKKCNLRKIYEYIDSYQDVTVCQTILCLYLRNDILYACVR